MDSRRSVISLLGIVNHLTQVEWRWIDGGFRGATALESYRARADATRELLDGTTGE